MSRKRLVFFMVLSAVVAAGLSSWLAVRLHEPEGAEGAVAEVDFHEWLHESLELTEEQTMILGPIEADFQKEEARLRAELERVAGELAHAITEHGRESAELRVALAETNRLQGKLQKLTLDHFYDMKEHLRPDQAEKLLKWTHESLRHEHESGHGH